MEQILTQSEVEWLRCLIVSKKLTPRLPEHVFTKFKTAQLIDATAGTLVLTEKGGALLRENRFGWGNVLAPGDQ